MTPECKAVRETLLTAGPEEIYDMPHIATCTDCRTLADRVLLTAALLPHHPAPQARSWTTGLVLLAVAATLLCVGLPVLQQFFPDQPSEVPLSSGPADISPCDPSIKLEVNAMLGKLSQDDLDCIELRMTIDPTAWLELTPLLLVNRRSKNEDATWWDDAIEHAVASKDPTVTSGLWNDADLIQPKTRALSAVLEELGLGHPLIDAHANGAEVTPELLDLQHRTVGPGFHFARLLAAPRRIVEADLVDPEGATLTISRRDFKLPVTLRISPGRHQFQRDDGATQVVEVHEDGSVTVLGAFMKSGQDPGPGFSAALRERLVHITNEGSQETVSLDGSPLELPAEVSLRLGDHKVEVNGQTGTFQVRGGLKPQVLMVDGLLAAYANRPAPGAPIRTVLFVNATAAIGASIRIDGEMPRTTPTTKRMTLGEHHVVVDGVRLRVDVPEGEGVLRIGLHELLAEERQHERRSE